MQPLVPLVFHNLGFDFWLCRMHHQEYKRFVLYMQLSFPSSLSAITVDTSLHLFSYLFRYAARGDHTSSQNFHNTRARGRSRHGTLSKMASFIVDSCRDLRFSLEMWDWRRTIAWGRCTLLTIVDQFGIKLAASHLPARR